MVSLESAEEAMARRGKIVEGLIISERPDLLELFLTYQSEAIAARKFLDNSLTELDSGAEILEVGGGILALAIQLASEGFKVTTVEPVGEGFSGILFIMSVFSEISKKESLAFELVESPIENCNFDHKFDFVFSINVMEHLRNPYLVLIQLVSLLKTNGKYRFFCPNYDFPYEPHFGKWLFNRKDMAFFLKKERATSSVISVQETQGLYESLNFITLKNIEIFSKGKNVRINSNQHAFYNLLGRVIHDSELKKRHPGPAKIVKMMSLLNLHSLAKLIPKKFQPVMDVEIYSSYL
jgi:2-polyprenyl-3-methyl-5-hydroxy-6-metoxy-1,4-benzoquinol methylase